MIIASIEIHQCDGCTTIAVLHSDEDCDRFAAEWLVDEESDHCPKCRVEIEKWEKPEGENA